VSDENHSRVIHFAEAQELIPGAAGERAIGVFRRGTLDVALSIPETPKQQTPHAQDEIYVIVQGRAVFLHDGGQETVSEGDLVFVAAGIQHQFSELKDHFTVWRVFYGPNGGEL
jgi:mannose-6-phosphate isomerase-like protein (cupin superfamily)